MFRPKSTLAAAFASCLTFVLAAGPVEAVTPTAMPKASSGDVVPCEFTPTPENPPARPVEPPRPWAKAHGKVVIAFWTNYGRFAVRMDRNNAPCAVHNFVHLTRSHFYDVTQCFRLTNSERLGVLQCGDLIRQEVGGPGYKFPDEVTGEETYPRGTVAMGNQGPGTNGSEFFVVHSHANIDPFYTILGKVIYGMSTLDRIVEAGIDDPDQDGPPRRPVWIYRVAVVGGHGG